jgi:hypothetical protein
MLPEVLVRFDEWLLENLFQRIVDRCAPLIGLSCAAAAVLCLDLASAASALSRAPLLAAALDSHERPACLGAFVLLILGLTALGSLRVLFRKLQHGRQRSPLRALMRPLRIMALALLSVRLVQWHEAGLSEGADLATLMLSACALYLGVCSEPPPVPRSKSSLVAAAS